MSDAVNAPAGGTPRGDARARLLEAAVAAFAAKGFHGTSTRDIAAAAGMSPAAVYVHHRSKEELLHQISLAGHERTLGLCRAAIEASDDPVEQLGGLVEEYVRYHAVHHTTARILNYELAALSAEHQAEIGAIRSQIDALLRDLLERGRRSGSLRVPHPTVTAAAILSLGIDLARWWREDGGWTPGQVAAHYRELVLAMVGVVS